MPYKKVLLYPNLLSCCLFCKDSFWENTFEDLAYGRCPPGTFLTKTMFLCSFKNKEINYLIEKKNPEVLYTEILNFLKSKIGLLSPKEETIQNKNFHLLGIEIKNEMEGWDSIKKKNIRDLLFELYVADSCCKYSLSQHQAKKLLSAILTGIAFKTITSKDITYSNGRIAEINGIVLDKKKIISLPDTEIDIRDSTQTIVFEKHLLSDNWLKYVKELNRYAVV